jgi:hypothetical protein
VTGGQRWTVDDKPGSLDAGWHRELGYRLWQGAVPRCVYPSLEIHELDQQESQVVPPNRRRAACLVLNCVTGLVRVCVKECVVRPHKEIHLTYSLYIFFSIIAPGPP